MRRSATPPRRWKVDYVHPRFLFVPADIDRMVADRRNNTQAWQRLKAWVDDPAHDYASAELVRHGDYQEQNRVLCFSLAWLAYKGTAEENDPTAQRCKRKMIELVDYYLTVQGEVSEGALGSTLIAAFFDLMYNDLSPAQRYGMGNLLAHLKYDAVLEWNRHFRAFEVHGLYRGIEPGMGAWLVLSGIPGMVDCSVNCETARCPTDCDPTWSLQDHADFFETKIMEVWERAYAAGMNEAFDAHGRGGGGHPTTNYVGGALGTYIRFALALKNATYRDVSKETRWFKDRLSYLLFHYTPEVWEERGAGKRKSPGAILWGDSWTYLNTTADEYRLQSAMLQQLFPDEPASANLKWYWQELFVEAGPGHASLRAWAEFGFDIPAVATKPTVLAHNAQDYGGRVHMRSAWADGPALATPSDTHIAVSTADMMYGHQSIDAGHFNIFKYGRLAEISGMYDGGGLSGTSYVSWNASIMGHNGIRIYDPQEISANQQVGHGGVDVIPHGGTRSHYVKGELPAAAWLGESYDKHNFSNPYVYSHDTTTHTYIGQDLTPAYNSDRYVDPYPFVQRAKVQWVSRDFTYLRPSEFIVLLDKITKSDYANEVPFKTTLQIHSAGIWKVSGAHHVIEGEQEVGVTEYRDRGAIAYVDHTGGRLFLDPVFPETTLFRFVGGFKQPKGNGELAYTKYMGFQADRSRPMTTVGPTEIRTSGETGATIRKGHALKMTCAAGEDRDPVSGTITGFVTGYAYDSASDTTTISLADKILIPEAGLADASCSSFTVGFQTTSIAALNSTPFKECSNNSSPHYVFPCASTHSRIEWEDTTDRLKDDFLSVMLPTAASVASMPATHGLRGTGLIGVHIEAQPENVVVIYSDAHAVTPLPDRIVYSYTATAPTRHHLMNAVPDATYRIAGAAAHTASSEGVLVFSSTTVGPQEIELTRDQ